MDGRYGYASPYKYFSGTGFKTLYVDVERGVAFDSNFVTCYVPGADSSTGSTSSIKYTNTE